MNDYVSYNLENIELNRVETAYKAKKFLLNDFQTYLNRAGTHRADLKSVQLEPTGVKSHGKNSAEANMFQIFDYESKCLAIYKAIEDCTENPALSMYNRDILHFTYIDLLKEWQVAQRIGLSQSRTRYKKQGALCEFAERLPKWSLYYDTRLPDLRVWKNIERVKENGER